MIPPTDPDEAVTLNGFPITGRQLAEARQELSHRGVHNPRWAELSQHDQDMAALSATNWLRALAELMAVPGFPRGALGTDFWAIRQERWQAAGRVGDPSDSEYDDFFYQGRPGGEGGA